MMQVVVIYNHHHLEKELVLAVALSSVAVALIIVSAFVACILWRRNQNDPDSKNHQGSDSTKGVPILSKFNSFKTVGRKGSLVVVEYSVLESATDNFNESNILGQGGFGFVYKACFDKHVIAAVKKLNCGGPDCEREFENEVELLGKIQHPNIISLLGYCAHGEMRFLVYELMQNGSLETQLHGPSHGSVLTWHIRMKIALDAARGLEYLHEHCNPPVIHRDFKSSNILLDSDFNAKVHMQGIALGRSVDLTRFNCYDELIAELDRMFEFEGELMSANKSWMVVYTDSDGDMMLVGDDPWPEFCSMVRKINIYTKDEVQKMNPGALSPRKKETSNVIVEKSTDEETMNPLPSAASNTEKR